MTNITSTYYKLSEEARRDGQNYVYEVAEDEDTNELRSSDYSRAQLAKLHAWGNLETIV